MVVEGGYKGTDYLINVNDENATEGSDVESGQTTCVAFGCNEGVKNNNGYSRFIGHVDRFETDTYFFDGKVTQVEIFRNATVTVTGDLSNSTLGSIAAETGQGTYEVHTNTSNVPVKKNNCESTEVVGQGFVGGECTFDGSADLDSFGSVYGNISDVEISTPSYNDVITITRTS